MKGSNKKNKEKLPGWFYKYIKGGLTTLAALKKRH